jgi:hypothetical protein
VSSEAIPKAKASAGILRVVAAEGSLDGRREESPAAGYHRSGQKPLQRDGITAAINGCATQNQGQHPLQGLMHFAAKGELDIESFHSL